MTSQVMDARSGRTRVEPMTTLTADETSVGGLLRTWRQRRRLSQLELSSRAEVSTRHLSCLETGRARPTPDMILRLAEHLEVPLRERNRLLLAGGYAPRYTESALDDGALAPVLSGLRDLLDAHLPRPALLLDERWTLLDANAMVEVLAEGCDPALLEPPVNVVRLSLHPDGLAPRIRNLAAWGRQLHRQVVQRAERTHDPRLHELAAEVATYLRPGPVVAPQEGPVLTMELATASGDLRLFSVAAHLETPADSTLEGLVLETFVPADDATEEALRRLSSTGG